MNRLKKISSNKNVFLFILLVFFLCLVNIVKFHDNKITLVIEYNDKDIQGTAQLFWTDNQKSFNESDSDVSYISDGKTEFRLLENPDNVRYRIDIIDNIEPVCINSFKIYCGEKLKLEIKSEEFQRYCETYNNIDRVDYIDGNIYIYPNSSDPNLIMNSMFVEEINNSYLSHYSSTNVILSVVVVLIFAILYVYYEKVVNLIKCFLSSLREKKDRSSLAHMSLRMRFLVFATVVYRIIIQMSVPVSVRGNMVFDDKLFADYTESLLSNDWLGVYNYVTLNKMPGFSFFLSFLRFFNIPYMLGIGVFYVFAAYVFYIAINKLIKDYRVSYVFFVYVLFSPVMFDCFVTQRIYRNSVLAPLALIVISSYMILLFDRKKGNRRLLPWSILAGLSYFSYAITVENYMWLTCFVFGATVLFFGLFFVENKRNIKIKVMLGYGACVLMPFLLNYIGGSLVKIKNYEEYGVYTTNDWNETYFAKMGKALIEIDYGEEIPGVYVNRETINKLYEISPNFAKLKDKLDEVYDSGTALSYENGEITRDFIMWYIRWTADSIGVYKDAVYANEFYKQVYFDVQNAFETGELKKKDAIILSNLAGPLRVENIIDMMPYTIMGFKEIMTYADLETEPLGITGEEVNVALMGDVISTSTHTYDELGKYEYYAEELEEEKLNIINDIVKTYQNSSRFIVIFVIMVYLLEIIIILKCIVKRQKFDLSLWLVKTGMFLTMFACVFSMAAIYYQLMPDNFREYYAAGVYPVWHAIVCISVAQVYLNLKEYVKRRKEHKNEINYSNTML